MVSILLCMVFSFYISPEVRVDLRLVPLVIGGLYFGQSFIFAGFAILVRSLIAIDDGFWVTVIESLVIAGLLHFIKPIFLLQTSNRRIFLSIGLSLVASDIFMETIGFFEHPAYNLEIWSAYFIVSTVGTGIIAYALETMNSNVKVREQLLKSKRMEAVSQMGAAISHEIRNPLTSARGFLQFINEGTNLDQCQSSYIEIAIKELDQAEEVISNYLTFAKPAIERVEDLDPHWILIQIVSELADMVETNKIKIERDFNSNEIILGDKQMMRKCFYNLIKNCIESMPDGGTLNLKTADTKQGTLITISDTGYGMTDEQLNRLGEPYYLISEGSGTGLSMMVVHSIVRAMNGSIDIKSKSNEGTTFLMSFPRK